MQVDLKNTLFFLGRPLSPLYSTLMKARAYCYRKGVFRQHRLDVPVLSVGNLTMGGTGKTPFVIYLTRQLREYGFNPAVISRGYRGSSRVPINVVSDGKDILMSTEEAGDEAVLMADKLPVTVIATGRKRNLPAAHVVAAHNADLIVLDDGFQHLSLARDLDLVLFDIDHFAGNSRVFPGGELREPTSALNRCDAFILTGLSDENRERAGKIEELLTTRFPEKPVFSLTRTYSSFYRYDYIDNQVRKTEIDTSECPSQLFAFSGIANPQRFYSMLKESGIAVTSSRDFTDHHEYRSNEIETLCDQAAQDNCSAFVTTEKDIVKLISTWQFSMPVYVPSLDYEPHEELFSFIVDQLKIA